MYFFIALIIALIVIYFFNKFAKRKQEEEGKQYPKFLISLGIFIILPALTFIIGGVDLSWSFPELKQLAKTSFTYEGGLGIPPELIALTLALTLYTATFIAENVRAGIQGCR
jgi:general L-amino acid transport system permease protein